MSSLKHNFHVKESKCFFIVQLNRKYPISKYDKGTEKTASAVKTLEKRDQEETILTIRLLTVRLLD